MRIQHQFEVMYDILCRLHCVFRDMYDIICRFLYRICCIDAINVRLQVVKRNNF